MVHTFPDQELVAVPAHGRTYAASRRVQPEETTPAGRLRLDALARYLANVAVADLEDTGLDEPVAWLARRTEVRVAQLPALGERVELVTFCSGTGPRWAERRTSLWGDRGSSVEAASTWVCMDLARGRPAPLSEAFLRHYEASAEGRRVGARLHHRDRPDLPGRPFALRSSDLDAYGHVNNAVPWEMVEEEVARRWGGAAPARAELEYRSPISAASQVEVVGVEAPGELDLWVVDGGETRVSGRLRPPTGA
ncbi:MAG TPA: acyl-ACP thioesterase domain-containing protein [Acidimicrobiales bacterium]|nr:acyl-ACP thioesterase domain-containing protein [Acidimicrobiales bacterium]